MGVLGTAAFDPVFYAHHANIDRLWQVWLGSDPTHANPSEGAWQQQGFYFYDQRRQWTRIEVRQLVDSESSLRYRYQQPSAPTRTPVAGGTTVPTPARSAPALRPMTQILELSVHSDGAALTPDPLTLQVDPPPPAAASLRAALEAPNRVILRIDGVEIPPDQAALVNVFLNRPAATASTETTVPGFVGTIVVVPNTVSTGAHVHRSLLHNFAFDVTEQIRRTAEPSGPLSVTLVPFQGDGTRPAEISLRYRRVYLVTQ
jgi:polyphenol oxidase